MPCFSGISWLPAPRTYPSVTTPWGRVEDGSGGFLVTLEAKKKELEVCDSHQNDGVIDGVGIERSSGVIELNYPSVSNVHGHLKQSFLSHYKHVYNMYFYHIYPLFTLQLLSDSNHISPPTLGCFSKVYWIQVMVSLLYIWVLGHLLRHEHPNGGHFLEENWHSLLQHPPSAKVSQLGAGLYKPSSHLLDFDWLDLMLVLCRQFLRHEIFELSTKVL